MNFSEINSPADLARFNEAIKEPMFDRISKLLCEEGNVLDNMPVIIFCLQNLIAFHERNYKAAIEGELDANPGAWASDRGKLAAALDILMSVDMPEPDSHLG